MPPNLLTNTNPATISAGTCHAQILHASTLGQQDVATGKSHFKNRATGQCWSYKVNTGLCPAIGSTPPSLMGFPLLHGRGGQAWLVGLAWRQAEVHEEKAKLPATEMLQDITASISIIILS